MEDRSFDYQFFLSKKDCWYEKDGFKPTFMPEFLYDFQVPLVDWAVQLGRSALFEDCGLGKTPQELVWAENVLRHTNKPVLILTPLAVADQFVREGKKFQIEVKHARDGKLYKGINVVNYQRLHYFDPNDLGGLVCDESGCLKHYDSKRRKMIGDFSAHIRYLLLCTATPAPNDFMELGNTSEILRVMKYTQMLGMFFVNDGKTTSQWSLLGHAKHRFWKWVSEWARALRSPKDLGFDDDGFLLPPIKHRQFVVKSPVPDYGFFVRAATTLNDQRKERRDTLQSRCEKAASLVPRDRPYLAWCHLNAESDLLVKLIPDAVQVCGSDPIDSKEEHLNDFSLGRIRCLVTKPTIAGFGLNWQHCSDMSFFPSHSWEAWYQAIRRCWRFGQNREVTVNVITSEAESRVLSNMQRKERQASEMYDGIIREMQRFSGMKEKESNPDTKKMELPKWL